MTPADSDSTYPNRQSTSSGGRTLGALGGIAAQGSQAAGSFVLQILAARLLGLDGLGRFAALYAIIVLATALCSGFVGDSLTVLDRSRDDVRAGLQAWLAIISLGAGLSCWLGSWILGFLSGPSALAFGGATVVFLFEDAFRRLLMASLAFWRIVVVDLAALASAGVVLVVGAGTFDRLTLTHFLIALMFGQIVASIAAMLLIPAAERRLARHTGPALAAVASYGVWRSVQQAVRPTLLALVRVECLLVVSTVALGRLEAARIYVAPALLAVGGISSYLFSSYAARSESPLPNLVRLADRSVLGLLGAIGAFGAVALLAMSSLGPVLTGGDYELSAVSVAGWVMYAASVAAVTPYGQLAAVRGRQLAVLGLRVADSVVSFVLVLVVLLFDRSVAWVPVALSVGSICGGLAIRQIVLRREVAVPLAVAEPTMETI